MEEVKQKKYRRGSEFYKEKEKKSVHREWFRERGVWTGKKTTFKRGSNQDSPS